jgi:hypothetical protein
VKKTEHSLPPARRTSSNIVFRQAQPRGRLFFRCSGKKRGPPSQPKEDKAKVAAYLWQQATIRGHDYHEDSSGLSKALAESANDVVTADEEYA